MSEMLDLVARAIWEKRREIARLKGIELEEWGDGSIPIANHIHSEALAAISAMREPTAEMADAFYDQDYPGDPVGFDSGWKAVFDKLLE